jgi:hypothetical protein
MLRRFAVLTALLSLGSPLLASPPGVLWMQRLDPSALPKGLEALPRSDQSSAAGYCLPLSGDQTLGQLLLWERFPDLATALDTAPNAPTLNNARLQSGAYTELGTEGLASATARVWQVQVPVADYAPFLEAIAALETALRKDGHDFRALVLSPAGAGVQDAGGLQLWALSPNGAAAGAVVDAYYAGAPWGPAWDAAYGYFKAVDSDAFLQCHPLPADPR